MRPVFAYLITRNGQLQHVYPADAEKEAFRELDRRADLAPLHSWALIALYAGAAAYAAASHLVLRFEDIGGAS